MRETSGLELLLSATWKILAEIAETEINAGCSVAKIAQVVCACGSGGAKKAAFSIVPNLHFRGNARSPLETVTRALFGYCGNSYASCTGSER